MSARTEKSPHKTKERLDVLLLRRGLAETRQQAQALILSGKVRVNEQRADKAGTQIALDARIEISGAGLPYVSRGGLKLEGALDDFGINPSGAVCLDVGGSTGGFTDCLLQHGAARVYVVDVTISQLAWKLQTDPRVVTIQKNARYLSPQDIPERPSLVVVDLSFISVTKVLPQLIRITAQAAEFLILVKPQFELQRKDVGGGGIVRDLALHQRAVEKIRDAAQSEGLDVVGIQPSRIAGADGNQEYFLYARTPANHLAR